MPEPSIEPPILTQGGNRPYVPSWMQPQPYWGADTGTPASSSNVAQGGGQAPPGYSYAPNFGFVPTEDLSFYGVAGAAPQQPTGGYYGQDWGGQLPPWLQPNMGQGQYQPQP